MKKMWLATVAVAVLSLPAMAQNSPTQEPQSGGAQMNQSDQTNPPDTQGANPSGNQQDEMQQDQMQQGSQDQSGQQQASERVDPAHLNKDQVTQIQQALDQKGFKTKSDGIWGRQTASAMRKFQEQNKIEGKGHLTEDTLAKLGVNLTGQPSSETTGAAPKRNDTSPDMKANPPGQNGASPDKSGNSGTNEQPMNPPADNNSGSPDQSK